MAITNNGVEQATEHVAVATNTITEPLHDPRQSFDVVCDECGNLVAVLDSIEDARNAAEEHEVACVAIIEAGAQ